MLKWDVETHICPLLALFSTAEDVALWWLKHFLIFYISRGLSYLQNSKGCAGSNSHNNCCLPAMQMRNALVLWEGQQPPGRLRGNPCAVTTLGSDAPPVWGPHRAPWPLASWGTQGGAGLHRHSCLPAGLLGKMNDFWANLNLLLWDLLLFHLLFLKKACIFKICISSPKCVCVFIVFVP